MHRRVFLQAALAVATLAVSGSAVLAAEALNLANGVALKGYDPVAYFTQKKPVKGSAAFTAEHHGATYQFASAANRDRFKSDPEHYAPQFGGFCAYGVAKGVKVDIDPKAFSVRDDKLYVNYDKDVGMLFKKDIDGAIATANQNWTKLKDAP